MWGSVGIIAARIAVINAATFQYGGGAVNTPELHDPLAVGPGVHHRPQTSFTFSTDDTTRPSGTHAYITNNNFYNNFDAAMQIEPNGLLAGNPLTPLRVGPSLLPRQRDAGQRHRRHDRRRPTGSTTSTPATN